MDGFDAYKVERGDEIVEFNLDDDSQEMEIIQTGSIFPTSSPSSSSGATPRSAATKYQKGRSRVEILPNDDERVVRAVEDINQLSLKEILDKYDFVPIPTEKLGDNTNAKISQLYIEEAHYPVG